MRHGVRAPGNWGTGILLKALPVLSNIGALIIRIRFWGPVYHNYNKEPPK